MVDVLVLYALLRLDHGLAIDLAAEISRALDMASCVCVYYRSQLISPGLRELNLLLVAVHISSSWVSA